MKVIEWDDTEKWVEELNGAFSKGTVRYSISEDLIKFTVDYGTSWKDGWGYYTFYKKYFPKNDAISLDNFVNRINSGEKFSDIYNSLLASDSVSEADAVVFDYESSVENLIKSIPDCFELLGKKTSPNNPCVYKLLDLGDRDLVFWHYDNNGVWFDLIKKDLKHYPFSGRRVNLYLSFNISNNVGIFEALSLIKNYPILAEYSSEIEKYLYENKPLQIKI